MNLADQYSKPERPLAETPSVPKTTTTVPPVMPKEDKTPAVIDKSTQAINLRGDEPVSMEEPNKEDCKTCMTLLEKTALGLTLAGGFGVVVLIFALAYRTLKIPK